jgi:hypothetical protein
MPSSKAAAKAAMMKATKGGTLPAAISTMSRTTAAMMGRTIMRRLYHAQIAGRLRL